MEKMSVLWTLFGIAYSGFAFVFFLYQKNFKISFLGIMAILFWPVTIVVRSIKVIHGWLSFLSTFDFDC